MLPIFYHYFDISFEFKASSEYFLANLSREFKTELNCLGFSIKLEIRFTHIILTGISASQDYPERFNPN